MENMTTAECRCVVALAINTASCVSPSCTLSAAVQNTVRFPKPVNRLGIGFSASREQVRVLRMCVWRGVVWCGVAWCGVVWCGVVWCGVVWCGVVWSGIVWVDARINEAIESATRSLGPSTSSPHRTATLFVVQLEQQASSLQAWIRSLIGGPLPLHVAEILVSALRMESDPPAPPSPPSPNSSYVSPSTTQKLGGIPAEVLAFGSSASALLEAELWAHGIARCADKNTEWTVITHALPLTNTAFALQDEPSITHDDERHSAPICVPSHHTYRSQINPLFGCSLSLSLSLSLCSL